MVENKFCPIMGEDCIKEHCAFWWSVFYQGEKPVDPMCVIAGIADGLADIAFNLEERGLDVYIKGTPEEE